MSDPVKEFESLLNDSKLLFAVGELGLDTTYPMPPAYR